MRQILLIIGILSCFSTLCFAQKKTAYAVVSRDSKEGKEIYPLLDRVYQQLKHETGDKRGDWPVLKVGNPVFPTIACFYPANGSQPAEIMLEMKAYDLCKKGFRNSKKLEIGLAFLIGHEMAHFYEKHTWEGGFGGTHFILSDKDLMRRLDQEEIADTYSAFLLLQTRIAPFKELDEIVKETLQILYEGYGWEQGQDAPERIPGYSVEKRKSSLAKGLQKAHLLSSLYKNANYMVAMGKANEAAECYRYILQYIKTRSLYNNLGISLLQIAKPAKEKYIYPLELDFRSGIRRNGDALTSEQRVSLINEAIVCFKKATRLENKNYYTAQLNLLSAQILKSTITGDDLDKAKKQLKKIEEKVNRPSRKKPALLAIAEGIILAKEGKTTEAKIAFAKAKRRNPNYNFHLEASISNNLRVLGGGDASLKLRGGDTDNREDHCECNLNKRFEEIKILSIKSTEEKIIVGVDKNCNNADLYCNVFKKQHTEGYSVVELNIVDSKSAHPQGKPNIGVGTSENAVRREYARYKPWLFSRENGFYLVYEEAGIIFNIEQEEAKEKIGEDVSDIQRYRGTLKEWCVFSARPIWPSEEPKAVIMLGQQGTNEE